jgi:hypothetical protein
MIMLTIFIAITAALIFQAIQSRSKRIKLGSKDADTHEATCSLTPTSNNSELSQQHSINPPEARSPIWNATDMGGIGYGREVTGGTTEAFYERMEEMEDADSRSHLPTDDNCPWNKSGIICRCASAYEVDASGYEKVTK